MLFHCSAIANPVGSIETARFSVSAGMAGSFRRMAVGHALREAHTEGVCLIGYQACLGHRGNRTIWMCSFVIFGAPSARKVLTRIAGAARTDRPEQTPLGDGTATSIARPLQLCLV